MDELQVKYAQAESVLDNDTNSFPEKYSHPKEENTRGVTETTVHPETRDENYSPQQAEKEESDRSTLREKVQSISGVFASVAITAVTAVAVTFSNAPVVNVSQFDISSNYVEYKANITNETGNDLVIGISNDSYSYQKKLTDGLINDAVKDLKPNTQYTFSIKSLEGLERTYYSKTFKTTRDPTEYDAKVTDIRINRDNDKNMMYVQFNLSDIYVYYSNFMLTIKNQDTTVFSKNINISDTIPISLENLDSPMYTLELTADTKKPSDRAEKIYNKIIYSAIIKN